MVLGVDGQDGSYLAEGLLDRGWVVDGVGRRPGSRWVPFVSGYRHHALDLSDLSALAMLLEATRPDAVFHVAAVHGSAGFLYEDRWKDIHSVNTISAHVVLEYLRCSAPNGVFVYLSSSKVFGTVPPDRIDESSPRYSSCIYTTTKNAATDLIAYYRKRHGINASVIWPFNHESSRRGSSYFVPHIVKILAESILDCEYIGEVQTLDFWGDWGDAAEFMDIIGTIAEESPGIDLLLATGDTLWAEDFIDSLFMKYGRLSTNHLIKKVASKEERPKKWQVDVSALGAAIGRKPIRTAFDVADDILRLNHPQAWARTNALRPFR